MSARRNFGKGGKTKKAPHKDKKASYIVKEWCRRKSCEKALYSEKGGEKRSKKALHIEFFFNFQGGNHLLMPPIPPPPVGTLVLMQY